MMRWSRGAGGAGVAAGEPEAAHVVKFAGSLGEFLELRDGFSYSQLLFYAFSPLRVGFSDSQPSARAVRGSFWC
ncbi:hypothetical protein SAMN05518855_102063 [Paenibacillus sp. CF384]|nr:hypothetical protein SAMN05518855_102063 [Paenibacillus sp. CF384]